VKGVCAVPTGLRDIFVEPSPRYTTPRTKTQPHPSEPGPFARGPECPRGPRSSAGLAYAAPTARVLAAQEKGPVCPVQGAGLAGEGGEGFDQGSDVGGGDGLFIHEDDAGVGAAIFRPLLEQRGNGAAVAGGCRFDSVRKGGDVRLISGRHASRGKQAAEKFALGCEFNKVISRRA